jgi:uncharacterized membrane protein YagU involved in acid resistance
LVWYGFYSSVPSCLKWHWPVPLPPRTSTHPQTSRCTACFQHWEFSSIFKFHSSVFVSHHQTGLFFKLFLWQLQYWDSHFKNFVRPFSAHLHVAWMRPTKRRV